MSENNKNTQNTSNNPEKKKNRGLVAVILALIVIIIILLLRSCGTGDLPNPDGPGGNNGPVFDLDIDSGAQEGKPEGRPIEEIQEELNKKVEDGMINISMNLNPVFADGKSAGNLLIMNEDINKYPQVVEIYRKDNNELIYKSGLIPVGHRVETGKLLVDLKAGTYECVAYFNAVNPETGALLGKAGAEILVIVQK